MHPPLQAIQQELRDKADPKAIAFFNTMVPGAQKIYGVKTPVLNELAKTYKEHGFELADALWESGALEEKIIAIKILEKMGKKDPKRLFKLIQQFAKGIDNWAVCDAIGMQGFRSIVKTHRDEIFNLAEKYNRSKDPWQRRLSLVMVEWYTRQPGTHTDIKKLVKTLENDEEYYVKKAVAWIKRNFSKEK
ncbi:MAG TPA: DNA alkylation repair protein [Chitinophagaceae bacterium]